MLLPYSNIFSNISHDQSPTFELWNIGKNRGKLLDIVSKIFVGQCPKNLIFCPKSKVQNVQNLTNLWLFCNLIYFFLTLTDCDYPPFNIFDVPYIIHHIYHYIYYKLIMYYLFLIYIIFLLFRKRRRRRRSRRKRWKIGTWTFLPK